MQANVKHQVNARFVEHSSASACTLPSLHQIYAQYMVTAFHPPAIDYSGKQSVAAPL